MFYCLLSFRLDYGYGSSCAPLFLELLNWYIERSSKKNRAPGVDGMTIEHLNSVFLCGNTDVSCNCTSNARPVWPLPSCRACLPRRWKGDGPLKASRLGKILRCSPWHNALRPRSLYLTSTYISEWRSSEKRLVYTTRRQTHCST